MSILGADLSCRCDGERVPAKESRILNLLLGCVSGSMARRAGSRIRGFGDVSHH